MKFFLRVLVAAAPVIVATSCAMLFAFVAVQQNYRQRVEEPLIPMAERIALALERGATPASQVDRNALPIDLTVSNDTWVALYQADYPANTVLESTGVLDGKPPQLPAGVFDMTTWRTSKYFGVPSLGDQGGETRFTWQPDPETRQAVVLTFYDGGWVAVGRSMKLVEEQIIALMYLFLTAWCVMVLATLCTTALSLSLRK